MPFSWSLAFATVILLVITRTPSNGFTIRKPVNAQAVPDLDTSGSSLVKIKDNVPVTIDANKFDDNEFNEDKHSTVIALRNSKDTKVNTVSYNEITEKTVSTDIKQIETTNHQESTESKQRNDTTFSPVNFLAKTSKSLIINRLLNEVQNNASDIQTQPSTVFENVISNTQKSSGHIIQSTKNTGSSNLQINKSKLMTTETVTSYPTSERFIITVPDSSEVTSVENDDIISTSNPKDETPYNEAQASLRNFITTTVNNLREDKLRSTTHVGGSRSSDFLSTITASTPYIIDTQLSNELHYKTEPHIIPKQTNYVKNAVLKSLTTTKQSFQNVLTYSDATTKPELQITQTYKAAIDQDNTTLSPWPKYTIIDRSKVRKNTNIDGTKYYSEIINVGTSELPAAKGLISTAVTSTSFTDLHRDFTNGLGYSTNGLNSTSSVAINKTPVFESSTVFHSNIIDNHTDKLDIYPSKRAGYLDNSETTTLTSQDTTTEDYMKTIQISNETDSFGSMYETEVSDSDIGEGIGNINITAIESQSQLAEDAMKEELLIERTLNENEILKSRHRIDRLDDGPSVWNDTNTVTEIVTEHTLSVKPINSDKRKMAGIYTMSPNYKLPKKIELQPKRPLVRDPDDNSWRNESISSLGIVFNPKNASKSFTEVLKNKTTELSNIIGKDDKDELPDLRLRLEKMAEIRKSKKKRINKFGDTVYSDYEESSENTNFYKEGVTSPLVPSRDPSVTSTTPLTPQSPTELNKSLISITNEKIDMFRNDIATPLAKVKAKMPFNVGEYYDTGDEYEGDYATLPKIDIKKFTTKNIESGSTQLPDTHVTRPLDWMNIKSTTVAYLPDRQPTVQYFPPTKKITTPIPNEQKVNINEYDNDFRDKISMYNKHSKTVYDMSYSTEAPAPTQKYEEPNKFTAKPLYTTPYQNNNLDKNMYVTTQRGNINSPETSVANDGNFNKASYVIKHYKDFINDAAKGNDEDKGYEYLPFTEVPYQGVTMNDVAKFNIQRPSKGVDYDYDTQFRRDVVNRFIDNFNVNSDRFKVDFPIMYNNSVVHRQFQDNGKVLASSNVFMKRMHEPREGNTNYKPCDVNCERMTIEISPSYELHYYVPDQEEREVMQPRPNTGTYRFTI